MERGNWPRYVALGDSLTAGRDDLGPGGTRIGWARRPDRIHPNASGHQLIADTFAALLLR